MTASQRRKAESILKKLYTTNEFGYTYQDPEARLDESDTRWLKKELGLNTHADFGLGVQERVHRMCVNCQARHLLKYHDTRDEKNQRIEPWSIDCDYVRGDMPPNTQEVAEKLSTERGLPMDEVLNYLQSTVDPVKWAEIMFGFSDESIGMGDGKERFIRNYQKEQLRCSSKRLVVREGRRSGKTFAICLKLLYLLLTHEIQEGYNPVTGEPEYRGPAIMIVTPYQMQLTNIFDELEKMIKRNQHLSRQISTGTGGGLYVRTPNYKIAVKDADIARSNGKKTLKMGGQIQGFVSGVGTKSDGSGGGTMRGQSADFLYLDEMDMINDDILDKVITPIRATSPNVRILATSTPIGARSKFYDWCFLSGTPVHTVDGARSIQEIRVGDLVHDAFGNIQEVRKLFKHEARDRLYTAKARYLPDLVATSEHPIATQRGWVNIADLSIGSLNSSGVREHADYIRSPVSELVSADDALDRLAGLLSRDDLTESYEVFGSNVSPFRAAPEVYAEQYSLTRRIFDRRRWKTYLRAAHIIRSLEDKPWLVGAYLAEGHVSGFSNGVPGSAFFTWNANERDYQRKTIEALAEMGIDAELRERKDNTGQVVVHDTAFAVAVMCLLGEKQSKRLPHWMNSEYAGFDNLLTGLLDGDGHYQSQDRSSWTLSLTARDTIYPLFNMLWNRGVPVGLKLTQNESKRDVWTLYTVHGEHGVYELDGYRWFRVTGLDSVDFVGEVYNFETSGSNSYVVNYAGVHNCIERPDWKEDYYPTTVLPHWDRIRKEILAETTQEGFEAEYMAHFIEGSYGVFKPSFIEKAWADYEYSECHPQTSSKDDAVKFWMKNAGVVDPSQLRIVMGIDWNQNAGTEFVVMAYSMSEHWWWVVETYNVPQSKWTSETFKREVIRLNHKWKPDWIYADKGWGHTIIEDLHLYALQLRSKRKLNEEEQAAVRLYEILKAFDFKANVELADPVSGDKIKKEGKTFLVENAIRVMETQRISYPFSDRTLTKQLQNYIITKYHASTNKPVYGMAMDKVGDHRLDAFMLALGGLFLEEGHFAKNNRKFVNPSLHKREDLIRREASENVKVDSAIEAARKAALLGDNYLTVTKVAYGETEELDALVRQIQAAETEVQARNTAYSRPRDSRSQAFKTNTDSVLDYYRAHARPDTSAYSKEDWHDHLDVLKRNDAKDQQRRSRSGRIGAGKRKMF